MDKNTLIGILLIGVIFIAFMFVNQKEQEAINNAAQNQEVIQDNSKDVSEYSLPIEEKSAVITNDNKNSLGSEVEQNNDSIEHTYQNGNQSNTFVFIYDLDCLSKKYIRSFNLHST